MPVPEPPSNEQLVELVNKVLKPAGSSLEYYVLARDRNAILEAMREVLAIRDKQHSADYNIKQ